MRAWRLPFGRSPLFLLPLVTLMIARGGAPLWFAVPLHLVTFGAASVLCLGRLAALRPQTRHLTEFYLWVAAGGTLGGVINSTVAPAVFTSVAEYPMMLGAACFLLAWTAGAANVAKSYRMLRRPIAIGLVTSIALAAGRTLQLDPREIMLLRERPRCLRFSISREPWRFALGISLMLGAAAVVGTAAWARACFTPSAHSSAWYRVSEDWAGQFVTLYHGTTVHGRQHTGSSLPSCSRTIIGAARLRMSFARSTAANAQSASWASASVPSPPTRVPAIAGCSTK